MEFGKGRGILCWERMFRDINRLQVASFKLPADSHKKCSIAARANITMKSDRLLGKTLSQFTQLAACGLRLAALLFLAQTATHAHPGIGIVKDSNGSVFYTDLKHVWKIDATGKKSIAVRNVHTHELFIDDKDNLYGEHLWYNGERLDTWGHYVWMLSAGGVLGKVIPDTEGFRKDFSFVRDHQGRMYHAQGPAGCQHIERVNTNKTTTIIGDQCLDNVRWMTASRSAQVFIVDGGDVKKMDANGRLTTLAVDFPQPKATAFLVNKDHYLGGLTVDKDQNLYVCDFSARNVKRISRTGEVKIVAETNIPWAPSGVLVDEETGDLWLLEYSMINDGRVEKIARDGKRTVY